ncbi:Diaminopimelate decarboxylase [Candidatus Entotheonellaceae bacterium PAL068K]
MATPALQGADLPWLVERLGTPFYIYDAQVLQGRIHTILALTEATGLQARYAMKACSVRQILQVMRTHGLWLDAVSGNEVLRAQAAGYELQAASPEVLLTTDVFRDNALDVICRHGVIPNLGSPGMVQELTRVGYRGPIALRLNPGFGHGHVQSCDTGGPSSKHGIWFEQGPAVAEQAARQGLRTTLLHAHVGSGPSPQEFLATMARLVDFFATHLGSYTDIEAINLGGGLPYPYQPQGTDLNLDAFGHLLRQAQARFSQQTGRNIRLEIEPGRYMVAPAACLVTRVTDIKRTETNPKGPGHTYVMVDAGFCDLIRPAMYGAFHQISVWQATDESPMAAVVVGGPLCESGDVFTRDSEAFLQPRSLAAMHIGDLVLIHDSGAYGSTMSSNYNSIGRVPQVWWQDGSPYLISRRETFEDMVRTECFTAL